MVLGCLSRPPTHALVLQGMQDVVHIGADMPVKEPAPAAEGICVEADDPDGDERARSLTVNGLTLSHATVLRSEVLQELLSLEGATHVGISIEAFKAWHSFSQTAPYSPASLAVVLQVRRPCFLPRSCAKLIP